MRTVGKPGICTIVPSCRRFDFWNLVKFEETDSFVKLKLNFCVSCIIVTVWALSERNRDFLNSNLKHDKRDSLESLGISKYLFLLFFFFFYIREYILLRIRVLNLINNKYNGIRINKFLKFSKFNNHQIVITIIYLTCKN